MGKSLPEFRRKKLDQDDWYLGVPPPKMIHSAFLPDPLRQFFTICASTSSFELILSPAREAASRLMSKRTR